MAKICKCIHWAHKDKKCWFPRKMVPKTSVCSCENVFHKQSCLLPPPITAEQEMFWRLLNSSVVCCLAHRTQNYQTKGRTHHSLCTKALFNTNSLLKIHSSSITRVSKSPGYRVAQVTSPRVHHWSLPAAPTGSATAGWARTGTDRTPGSH